MPLFSKKPVAADRELAEADKNIGTMQDDVAAAISKKNKGAVLTGKWNQKNERTREMQRDLANVYTDDDGQIPDLTKLEQGQRPLWQTILYTLVAVFATLFVTSVVGFLVFSNLNNETFTNEKVTFKVEPPIALVAGQEQTYTILITNKEKVNLYNLNIELLYPEAFQYVSGTPEATGDKKNTWDISVLKVGETQEIKFIGKLIAPLNSVHTLSGVVSFRPENINADFKQKTTVDLGITSSVVVVIADAPTKLLANQSAEFGITIKNIGKTVLNNLEVVTEYPQGFIFASSSPDAKDGTNNLWEIKKLATSTDLSSTSTDVKIVFRGNYAGLVTSGNQEIKVRVNWKNNNDTLLMAEQSLISEVVKDQLSLSLIVNGSGEDQAVSFEDVLFYTLSYKNTGQDELKNIELAAVLNSQILNWETFLDQNGGKVKDNTIAWTGKEIPKLLSLRPGEEGEISWQIRVNDLATLNKDNITTFSIENSALAKIKNASGVTVLLKSKVLINSINSDLSLKVGARYYSEDNVAVGAGPITPKIGEPSSYNIKISLANNLHDIGNIEVSALLPKNISWDNKTNFDTGEISYNQVNRKVIWKISKLPKTAKGANANFNISITPQESDAGRVLVLLPEIKLVAKDLETGADVFKTLKAITTTFDDPILGQVSGIVE